MRVLHLLPGLAITLQVAVTTPLPITIVLRRPVDMRPSERSPAGTTRQLRGVTLR